jgi:uncharacterized damage-inducible protein DinB
MAAPQTASQSLVTPSYVRTMAAYNAEMNRRIYAAAARLPESARQLQRGAFWGSIHGTLCHLLWGDQAWMSRFDDWPKPTVGIKQSWSLIADFQELSNSRIDADRRISSWAARVGEDWLGEEMVWFSQAANQEQRQPRSFLVMHLFNHQTHHRGQVHAMLTACGEKTGDTDLFLVVGSA